MDYVNKMNLFNRKDAILLAGMCYQAYPLFYEGKLTLPQGYKLRLIIRALADVENPTEVVIGFVAESKEQIVVAFRGYAAYPADLLAAYDIIQIPFPFVRDAGKTSRGFTCLYRSTRDELIRKINHFSGAKRLLVAGHNYGGAIAVMAALDIAVNTKFEQPFVYTYGSPRIGDPAFAHRFNQTIENSFRIVNIHDPYSTFPDPKYPPPFTTEGIVYQHVSTKFPIAFQLENTPRNDAIACYFKGLRQLNPIFSQSLCTQNPGFCPDTEMCMPFEGVCKPEKP
ncbi:lipase family protein [Brevibacillus centrosporus]|uniref:lipase family protein n=1 Tax=Brevibacillus centrosporus TaxID=54910 RepID=UPI000F0A6359|nr:lipase family protein [Brevibacillus centrosporus]MEC2128361.1 lipase family protein [Brevibacillus centrosporus]RNB73790.1 lipase family protein [Brevibacillus centrosporus]